MSAPAPNLKQAAAFLRLLDPEAERFTFQTFDDTPRKSDSLAKIYHGSLDELSGSLATLQGSGAGVFVTVNETDLQGRKTTNVKRVRAVFADLDGAPLAPVLACPLEPHIVVESSPEKFHAYWLVEDLPLEAFEPVQRAIAARFGGDPQVNDLPRVMRLPGFLHQKGAPAYSCISHVNERLPYHVSEILAEFPPASRSDPIGNGRDHEAEAMADLVRQILTGEHYHAPLCALAWRHINAGMPGGQVVETLRGLMHASTGPRDARWNAHYAEIPRTVGTAQDKLEAGRPQVEFTFLKGDQERASDDQERASDDQGQAPGNEQPDPQPKARIINLRDFGATRFAGPPPQIRWLVKDSIPLGVPVLLAAMGGIGKSFLSLQLCHGIATPPAESAPGAIDLNVQWPILGGSIAEHGKAVLITAEDSDAVIHRRLAVVDPYGRRTNDLMIVALPSAGGPMPLFVQDRNGVRTTADWHMIRDQLLSIEGLRLIAIDPLAAFAQVPLDVDSAAAQFVMSAFGQLASETGATVLLCHHMRKSNNGKTPQTPAEARDAIRGSSAIVDGVRLAYALWPVDEAEGKRVCNTLKVPFLPDRVAKGAIVKTNERGGDVCTYVRNDGGLLVDYTNVLRGLRTNRAECLDLLEADVAAYAEDMMPLQKTGNSGVHEQRECLHPTLRALSRDQLRALCQELIDARRIVKCRVKGSTSAVWLDVPDGPFARSDGEGEIRVGARTMRHSGVA